MKIELKFNGQKLINIKSINRQIRKIHLNNRISLEDKRRLNDLRSLKQETFLSLNV